MNKVSFEKNINKVFKNISASFFEGIEKYKIFLNDYNKKINLTRLDSESKIYGEYFYESIVPYKNIHFNGINSILDIGSGSGIPGIVLKLLYPHIKLTIIEANNKKCVFLKELSKELNIDVKILNQRAENILKEQRDSFDLVTSRAVAPLPIILEISLPYVKINGLLVEPKSKKGVEELFDIERIVTALGGKLQQMNQFYSINDKFHMVIMVRKEKKTNVKYPREWNTILKGFK